MTTARDITTKDPIIVDKDKTARDVAHLLATNGIGAVVVCGSGDEMQGMVTDRDLAVGETSRCHQQFGRAPTSEGEPSLKIENPPTAIADKAKITDIAFSERFAAHRLHRVTPDLRHTHVCERTGRA